MDLLRGGPETSWRVAYTRQESVRQLAQDRGRQGALLRWAQQRAETIAEDAQRPTTGVTHHERMQQMETQVADAEADLARVRQLVEDVEDELIATLNRLSDFLPNGPSPLARGLNDLGDRWDSLSPWEQILISVVIAAGVAASGGSLGVAIGVSGAATYGMAHAHGAATFLTDPNSATRGYFSTVTPLDAAGDVAEGALTFGPWAFGGAVMGRGANVLLTEGVAPSFAVARASGLAADAGVIDFRAFLNRDPIVLADGEILKAVEGTQQAAAAARVDDRADGALKVRGAAADYQVQVFGSGEKLVRLEGHDLPASVDGISTEYGGTIGDAKWVGDASKSSFNNPASFASVKMQDLVVQKMDVVLLCAADAADAFRGSGVVEIVTNNVEAASAWEARMRALGVPGYVRIHPGG